MSGEKLTHQEVRLYMSYREKHKQNVNTENKNENQGICIQKRRK